VLTLSRRKRAAGSHAAGRDPDEAGGRGPLPVVTPGMRSLAAALSGQRQMLAAGLTKMPDDDVARLAKAARDLQVFAAAVLRTRDTARPPLPGWVLCLPCLLRDCRMYCGCTDPECAHRKQRQRLPDEPGDITRAMAAVPVLSAPAAEPDGCAS
jgi:hypothetical protein